MNKSRSLISTQLTLLFFVPGLSVDGDSEAANEIHKAAHERISSEMRDLPGMLYYIDDHGNESQTPTGTTMRYFSIFDYDFEIEMVDGRPTYTIAFEADQRPPESLVTTLIHFCLERYKEVNGSGLVPLAQVKVYNQWNVSEQFVLDMNGDHNLFPEA